MAVDKTNDGTVVVGIDSSKAESGLTALERRLLSFGASASSAFQRVTSSFNSFVNQVGSGGGGGGRIGSIFSGAAGAMGKFIAGAGKLTTVVGALLSVHEALNLVKSGIRFVVSSFQALMSKVIEVNNVYQAFIASMGVIKGSTAAAAEEYQWLLSVSNALGTDVEASITGYHRLAAAMKNVDQNGELTRQVYVGLSEAMVVLHSSGRDANLILEAVVQMASKGKLSLEELQRQLGNTLPGAVATMAKAMMNSPRYIEAGVKSVAEAERKLRDDIKNGTINVYEAIARFSNQLKKDYAPAIDYVTKQYQANFNRMKNSWFEFTRTVGTSGAMEGLTNLLREITGLFSDAGDSSYGLGKALGEVFNRLAGWVRNLSADDIREFFGTIDTVITVSMIVIEDFIGIFSNLLPETKTPMLSFVEFITLSVAAVVDIFRVSFAGIETVIRSFVGVFLDLVRMSNKIPQITAGVANKVAQNLPDFVPGAAQIKAFTQSRSDQLNNVQDTANFAQQDNLAALYKSLSTFLRGPKESTFDKVGSAFDATRKRLAAAASGGKKAGSSATDAAKYVNPMGDADLQKLIDEISLNSGAPNSGKSKGPKGKDPAKELERQRKEFDRLSDSVSRWRGEAGYSESAQEKLVRAEGDLSEAVRKHVIEEKDKDAILAKLKERWKDQLQPIQAVLDEYDRAAVSLKYVGDAANEYSEILKQQEKWRDQNVKYDEKDIENLRLKIQEQNKLTRMQSAMGSVLGDTVYKQRGEMDKIEAVGNLKKGYENPDGSISKISGGQADQQAVGIFGDDAMKGTQEYYGAVAQGYEDMVARIQAARDNNVISEQTANSLLLAAWAEQWEQRIAPVQDALGQISDLMNSSNKKAFAIGKAAAIAQATIAGIQAAINAYNSGMQLGGPIGPAVGAAFMAVSIASTAMQISKIRAQQPPAYATGGSYQVGGSGGVDSQLVQFRATPGEKISINTPSQARAAERIADHLEARPKRSGQVVQNLTIVQQGKADRKTPRQQARAMRQEAIKLVS